MINTPEERRIFTPEEGQYWGAFLGNALYFNIDRSTIKSRQYFAPEIAIHDQRRPYLDHVRHTFGGLVVAERGEWAITNTSVGLSFARTIQPYMISQQATLESLTEFMQAKQDRLSLAHRPSADDREDEERGLYERFIEAKYAQISERKIELTPATLAGLIDGTGYVGILRRNLGDTYPHYNLCLIIPSNDPNILQSLESQRGATIPPEPNSEEEEVLEVELSGRPYWRVEGLKAFEALTIAQPQVQLLDSQVDLALAFYNTQNELRRGELRNIQRTMHRRNGDLAQALVRNNTYGVDLITVLRQGFYSSMNELHAFMRNAPQGQS